MSEYTPTFAISFINKQTGAGLIDCGTNDRKTPSGAARNWWKNCGHVVIGWLEQQKHRSVGPNGWTDVTILMRPITSKPEAISHSIEAGGNIHQYIARELSQGATRFSIDDICK